MTEQETGGVGESSRLTSITALARWEKLKKSSISHFGLLLVLILYTAAGAKIFQELEESGEVERIERLRTDLADTRRSFVEWIVNGTKPSTTRGLSINGDSESVAKMVMDDLRRYERIVETFVNMGISMEHAIPRNGSHDTSFRWNYMQSVFFASTVLTTIGYGNTAPRTMGGRLFCMLFALVGIPVTLTVIADLGKLFASLVAGIWRKLKRKYFSESNSVAGAQLKKRGKSLLVFLAVLFLLLYIAAGGAMFTLWENWSFFEGFYFCFITMTTIGFGDIVPEETHYMLICTIYILIGLALTSTIIELVRRQYAQSWQRMKELSNRLHGLSGPLADTLRKLGENAGRDINIDVNLLQDLREMRRLMGNDANGKGKWPMNGWAEVEDALLAAEHRPVQPIIQIIFYESSV